MTRRSESISLAFHITFGTYGTRLHGDERGTVSRRANAHGDPIIGRDDDWLRMERAQMKFDPVLLNEDLREYAETVAIPAICGRGGWKLHAAAVAIDHVHVLLTAKTADGAAIRKWFKRWLSEALSSRFPLLKGARWWARGGSVKHIWDERYLENVRGYIEAQRFCAR